MLKELKNKIASYFKANKFSNLPLLDVETEFLLNNSTENLPTLDELDSLKVRDNVLLLSVRDNITFNCDVMVTEIVKSGSFIGKIEKISFMVDLGQLTVGDMDAKEKLRYIVKKSTESARIAKIYADKYMNAIIKFENKNIAEIKGS